MKVVALLVVIDCLVPGILFESYIIPRFVTPFPILRDRTAGQDLSILLGALSRIPPKGVRIALVGDSTMNAVSQDSSELPYFVADELRQALPETKTEVVHCGLVGLYMADGALFVDKLLSAKADVIVYGVELRAFPLHTMMNSGRTLRHQMSPAELLRLLRVGAASWLSENLDAESVVLGLLNSGWATYAYRDSLRRMLWEDVEPHLRTWPTLQQALRPMPISERPEVGPRGAFAGPYELMAAEYGGPNPNWVGLELLGRLCGRYLAGRCVLYAGPVNPAGRARFAEPGLYDEYVARLRVVAGRHGLIFRDYTDAMQPPDFRPPSMGLPRDPIHLNEGGRRKLAALLREPVAEAVRQATATRSPAESR